MTKNNWLNKVLDVGIVRENKTLKLAFVGTPYIPEILNIISACGCTNVVYDEKLRLLNVTFKSGKIPNQIKGDKQTFSKLINIIYKDGTQDELYINGTKLRG